MPNRREQPQGNPEEYNLYKDTRVSSALTAFGSGLIIYGIDKREPLTLGAGYGFVTSGIIWENYISKEATRKLEDSNTTLSTLPETNRKESIMKASNDFINDHRGRLMSKGANLLGGLFISKGITDRSLPDFLIGFALVGYGSIKIYSSLKMADETVSDANRYIDRVRRINAREERLDRSRPGRYEN